MSIVGLARPGIRALHAYEAGEQVDDTVRLNANESPDSLAAGRFRRPLNRYPEVRPQKLAQLLASRFGCNTNELLVTRGSSEGIDLVIRSFCEPRRDSLVLSEPSFVMYRHFATVQDACIIEVPAEAERDFAIDADALLAACDATTKLVFVCSPNNPTGTLMPRADLERLLEALTGRCAVVVDEAYVEFGGEPSVVDLLPRYENLVILRTLSKALGFAGARCGAVIAHPPVIEMLAAVQAPYALATPVVECVEDALEADAAAGTSSLVAAIVDERRRMESALMRFGFIRKMWPSHANFLLVQVDDARRLVDDCRARGVLIRYFGGQLPECVRISIGSPEENDRLLAVLDALEIRC